MALFTVDWEDWNHALHVSGESLIEEPTLFILSLLRKYNVKAIFYMLGRAVKENKSLAKAIASDGHTLGDHGTYHDHNEVQSLDGSYLAPYRSPYWDTTPMPYPPSGGFFFRFMPFWYVKWAIKKSGKFWIHPHDVMIEHPKISNPILNWKRHVGLKTSRVKLDRLLSEVKWDVPNH